MGGAAENFSGLLRGLVIDNSYSWQGNAVFDRMMDALHDLARAHRGTEPTVGIIGPQSVKMTEAPARGRQGIYGLVRSSSSGAHLRVDATLPLSCKGCRVNLGNSAAWLKPAGAGS